MTKNDAPPSGKHGSLDKHGSLTETVKGLAKKLGLARPENAPAMERDVHPPAASTPSTTQPTGDVANKP